MDYLRGFRDKTAVENLARSIREIAGDMRLKRVSLMEVCGTHTMAIARFGIRSLLPDSIRLISGPGCPVCVTPNSYLDRAIALSRLPDVIITTFGDMMRVPGSSSSLEEEKSKGADVRVVYSTLDALRIAEEETDKNVVFLGVGFETTTPTIAAVVKNARSQGIGNFYVLCGHKVIPPAMIALAVSGEIDIDGFICPGHVSTIIGAMAYEPVVAESHLPCVVAGFEPADILQAIEMLLKQIADGEHRVEIQYSRTVRYEGNPKARAIVDDVFETCDSEWRGIGVIPASGLAIRKEYADFDAAVVFDVDVEPTREHTGCICGQILKGIKEPPDCPLYGRTCTPRTPVGACMVSSEGTCAAYYKYGVT